MPAKPFWFHRLDEMVEELKQLQTSFLDRHAVQKLFGVGERRSRQLMTGLPGVRIGNALAVDRLALLAKLQGVAASDECGRERNRKQRLTEDLETVRKLLAARRIQIPTASDASSQQLAGLPDGIELKPGELRIKFQGAETLAALLFALSQAMANDWPAFQSAVEESVARPLPLS